ncbi:MAG: SCO family protein [Verrucomicrobia bacterium]|jgi:protein SCO1|nr:SCO family protein [Verrucomicrobiota bacterium]
MFRLLALLVCCIRLSAATETGRVASVAADGWAKVVPAKGEGVWLRRFSEGDRKVGWVGRTVRYEAVAEGQETQARGVVSADAEELRQVAEVTDALRRETADKGRMVTRMPNELMPNMALWDQDGRLVMKKDFLGHPLALNFIFTSCRSARMCPASSACMKQLGDVLAKTPGAADVRLLTITFDPETDTPGVLRTYADGYGIDHARHRFLTGDAGQIKDLMRHYGIQTLRDDGTIVHNAALLVISPEGRIAYRSEGPSFDAEAIAERLLKLSGTAGTKAR